MNVKRMENLQFFFSISQRVNLHRILPCLVKENVNAEMIPFVLPNMLLIAELVSKDEFLKYILPILIPVFKIKEPIQVIFCFVLENVM